MECKDYGRILSQLNDEAYILVFLKKDGSVRTMLATRDPFIANDCIGDAMTAKLNSYGKRCNASNGNIAVVDLLLADVRSFSVDRLLKMIHVDCSNKVEFEKACQTFNTVKASMDKVDTNLSIDNIDVAETATSVANNVYQEVTKENDILGGSASSSSDVSDIIPSVNLL